MCEDSLLKNNRASNLERILAFGGFSLGIGALVLVKFVNPTTSSIFPTCPFHDLTGLNCPGCGATRGMHALLNGDFSGALHYNLMLIIFVPAIIYLIATLFSVAFRGRSLPLPRVTPVFLLITMFLLIGFGVARNLPFYPFNLLAI